MESKPIRRGRPVGSSPFREDDDKLLARIALQLEMGLGADFTNLARGILGDDEGSESALKRLQKKWKSRKVELLQAAAAIRGDMRWKFDEHALRMNQPELHKIAAAFAQSSRGAALLRAQDVDPTRFMSLGVVRLWELISEVSPVGKHQADVLFPIAFDDWASTGLQPDEEFLKRIAELALEKARQLADQKAANQFKQKVDKQ